MFDRIDAFVRDVGEVETKTEIAELLAEVSREMGFAYFALTLGTCAAAFNRQSGLDMRDGHPAQIRHHQARFSRLGAVDRRPGRIEAIWQRARSQDLPPVAPPVRG